MRGDTPPMQLPLEDVKILDLSHALAGPFCSTMLGDFGAQVVKVEVPGAADIARGWGPPFYNTETAYFVSLHRNKKSIEIDFKKEAGKELFFRMVERFDVVLENYRVGTLDKLGIAYDQHAPPRLKELIDLLDLKRNRVIKQLVRCLGVEAGTERQRFTEQCVVHR